MMTSDSPRVELRSVEVLPGGESFAIELIGHDSEVRRIEMPCWSVHQLMRLLPHLDAALLRARNEVTSDLIAYPVVHWGLEPVAVDDCSVALSLRTDRGVEAAFLFAPDDAGALQSALEAALAAGSRRRATVEAG